MIKLFELEGYDPNALFDELIERFSLRNDAALARKLGVGSPMICKVRQKRASITGDLLIRIWDVTGISINELRGSAGIPIYQYPPVPVAEPVQAEEVAHV